MKKLSKQPYSIKICPEEGIFFFLQTREQADGRLLATCRQWTVSYWNAKEDLTILFRLPASIRLNYTQIWNMTIKNTSCFFVSGSENFYSKTNQMHQCLKFILEWHSTCFGQSFCPSSAVQDCTYSNCIYRYFCLLTSTTFHLSTWRWQMKSAETCSCSLCNK